MVGRRTFVRRGAGRREAGAAAVEFALVAPLLITLLFGIISYGYLLSFRQGVSQAAAEGARAAASAPANADHQAIAFAAVESALSAKCAAGDGDPLSCTTSVPSGCATCLAVTVTWNYKGDSSKPKLVYGFVLPDNLSYTSVSHITKASTP